MPTPDNPQPAGAMETTQALIDEAGEATAGRPVWTTASAAMSAIRGRDDLIDRLADRLSRLTRLVAEGEEALGPFAEIGERLDPMFADGHSGVGVDVGWLRRAAEVRQRMKNALHGS